MPNIPENICSNININRKDLIDLLLISIALEELSLSHILNSQGELMQLVIKQLKCEKHFNSYELIKFNRNMSETLRLILEKEKILKEKLIQVIHFNEDQIYHHEHE